MVASFADLGMKQSSSLFSEYPPDHWLGEIYPRDLHSEAIIWHVFLGRECW